MILVVDIMAIRHMPLPRVIGYKGQIVNKVLSNIKNEAI